MHSRGSSTTAWQDKMIDIETINSEFSVTRGLTCALLARADPSDLDFAIDGESGALWKQFRHIGRVHENYLTAIESASMTFTTEGSAYDGGASQRALLDYFSDLDQRHRSVLSDCDRDGNIDWFGDPVPLGVHLLRLLNHETLHHGQLIITWRALKKAFPDEWQMWGL